MKNQMKTPILFDEISITRSPTTKIPNQILPVSIARVYYPVDIYFAELFGFDGLELSFF